MISPGGGECEIIYSARLYERGTRPLDTGCSDEGTARSAAVVAVIGDEDQEHALTAEVTVDGSTAYDTTMGGSMSAPVLRVDSVTETGPPGQLAPEPARCLCTSWGPGVNQTPLQRGIRLAPSEFRMRPPPSGSIPIRAGGCRARHRSEHQNRER